ncbi:LAMI_0G15434g1_1 [Lachancea mirantina]|uniref:LAMI_0G15434g1_1 n=1 Tax=Lachancea mirantina TaxID=1230905 RepID=A0A1G4KCD0_9SACH|nr:LAMI_0G15434g1_1 [Lachancea mirantina]
MEYIRVAKVDDVVLHRKGFMVKGVLHLTTHHLIFSSPLLSREFWVSYPTIGSVFLNNGSAMISKSKYHSATTDEPLYRDRDIWAFCTIKFVGKDFSIFSLDFEDGSKAQDVFDSVLKLTVLSDMSQLYAFIYTPNAAEAKVDYWNLYNPLEEFRRQGLTLEETCKWRLSKINDDFNFCKTYPNLLVVPQNVSDTLLTHAAKYRSQNRIPVLSYYHKKSGCSITRCAQPLPGIIQQRSVQDETLVREIFGCSRIPEVAEYRAIKNLIIDARPSTNAMAQKALGGGSENMDNYNFGNTASRVFLGIDNIHVMRDSLNYLVDNFLVDSDLNLSIDKSVLNQGKASSWLKYVRLLLSSTDKLAKSLLFNQSNIMIHCSDGWDRTSQVCSLVQICIDPYFRTLEGFMVLIEKDWLSFGHRFAERSGHLSFESAFHNNLRKSISGTANNVMTQSLDLNASFFGSFSNAEGKWDNNLEELGEVAHSSPPLPPSDLINRVSKHLKHKSTVKLTSPVFQQFLDCVYQLLIQFPNRFEFNERFLRRLLYHLYSCQYGTFLYNSEQERTINEVKTKTRSAWDYFKSRDREFINVEYDPKGFGDEDWILPDLSRIQWWWQLFGKRDEEMNGPITANSEVSEENDDARKLRFPKFTLDLFGKK